MRHVYVPIFTYLSLRIYLYVSIFRYIYDSLLYLLIPIMLIDIKQSIERSINAILTTTIIIILVYTRKLNLAKSFDLVLINTQRS